MYLTIEVIDFQSSYKTDESATILSVNKDQEKSLHILGYFLLFYRTYFKPFYK